MRVLGQGIFLKQTLACRAGGSLIPVAEVDHASKLSAPSTAFKGVCKFGTNSAHFGHEFQIFDDHVVASGLGLIRDPQQRPRRLRGLTTTKFSHATAGKHVNRVSNNAQLRSSSHRLGSFAESLQVLQVLRPPRRARQREQQIVRFEHCRVSPAGARSRSGSDGPSPPGAPLRSSRGRAERAPGWPARYGRSPLPSTAPVAWLSASWACARIVAPPNPTDQDHRGPTTAPAPFTRFNNLRSNHATAGKQPREGDHPAELRSWI
jgi:hypothetical protein